MVKPLTEREEREFVPLTGFDEIFGDNARGIKPQPPQGDRVISPIPSSSSIEEPETPRSVKKSWQKLRKAIESPLDRPGRVEKVERRWIRLETKTVTKFEEVIIKDNLLAKSTKVRSEYTHTNRTKRQITKVKVLTTKDANARIAQRTEKENQQWVQRVRRENAKKLAEEEATAAKLAELRRKALAGSDIDRMFEPFDIFFEDREGDSSLRV